MTITAVSGSTASPLVDITAASLTAGSVVTGGTAAAVPGSASLLKLTAVATNVVDVTTAGAATFRGGLSVASGLSVTGDLAVTGTLSGVGSATAADALTLVSGCTPKAVASGGLCEVCATGRFTAGVVVFMSVVHDQTSASTTSKFSTTASGASFSGVGISGVVGAVPTSSTLLSLSAASTTRFQVWGACRDF